MGQLHGIVILQVCQLDYRWDSYIKGGTVTWDSYIRGGSVTLHVGQLHYKWDIYINLLFKMGQYIRAVGEVFTRGNTYV